MTFGPAYSGHRVSFGDGPAFVSRDSSGSLGAAVACPISIASSVSGLAASRPSPHMEFGRALATPCVIAVFAIGVPAALGVSAVAAVGVPVALGVPVGLVVIGAGLNPGFFSDGDSQDSIARAMADGLVTFLQGWKVRT